MDRRMVKPTVRRCLFERATNPGEFFETQKRLDREEKVKFERKWHLDGVGNGIQWSKADADIPEYYMKGYSHKCRRRALRPCIGKSLSFADSDAEDSCEDVTVRASSPVQYCARSTVEVFLGLLPHQSPQEPVTPKKSDFGDSHTSKSENSDASSSDIVSVSKFSAKFLRRKLTQKRLTDMWRVLKRRQRSLVSGQLHKKARIDRL